MIQVHKVTSGTLMVFFKGEKRGLVSFILFEEKEFTPQPVLEKEDEDGTTDHKDMISISLQLSSIPSRSPSRHIRIHDSQLIQSPSQLPSTQLTISPSQQEQTSSSKATTISIPTSRQILLVFNGEYVEEAQNLLESMRVNTPHLVKDVIVCVSDDKANKFAKDNDLRSFTLSSITKYGAYNSPAFKIFTKRKMEAVLYLLERGMKILYTDTDIVFLKDPTIFSPDQSKGYSTLFQIDGRAPLEIICTGFFFADPTKDAISLFNATIEEMARGNFEVDDQRAIEALPAEMLNKTQRLDLCQFPTGIRYFENDVPRCKHDDAFIVHNNWVLHPDKKNRLIKNHLWFIKT